MGRALEHTCTGGGVDGGLGRYVARGFPGRVEARNEVRQLRGSGLNGKIGGRQGESSTGLWGNEEATMHYMVIAWNLAAATSIL